MLKTITMSRYSHGTSTPHRLDPRTKIILTLLFMVVVLFLKSYSTLLVLLLFTLTVTGWTGKPFKQSMRGLKPILWFALVTLLVNVLFSGGSAVSESGLLRHVSREGFAQSVTMILRLILLVSGTSLLTFTTSPLALTDGLEKLMKPFCRFGVSVHELAMMMTITLRFMPVIADEAEKLIKAQSSRCAAFGTGSLRQRVASHLSLMVPLFVCIVKKGDALATAMEARCYSGDIGRTRMKPLAFSGADFAGTGVVLAVFAGLLLIEFRAL